MLTLNENLKTQEFIENINIENPTYRLSKQSQKKSSSNCPENLTEFQWAEMRGLKKIWDFGKKRWVYTINPNKTSWKENLSSLLTKSGVMVVYLTS